MTMRAMDEHELPSSARGRYSYTDEEVEEAIAALKAGKPATDDKTYDSESAARRAGLALRGLIKQRGIEFENGKVPSSHLWSLDEGKTYHWAVLLREPVADNSRSN